MRRTILLAFTAIAMLGASAQNKGFDTANLDTSIKPGDDFYQYAAGGWLRSHPLDDEHTDNGAFTDLYEKSQVDIQELILQYANTPQQKGTLGQKIGSLYNLMMDSVRLNREGWQPLRPTLEQIAAIKDRREYQLVTAQLDYKGENTMMYGIGVGADQRNASQNIVGVGQGGIGLSRRCAFVRPIRPLCATSSRWWATTMPRPKRRCRQ